MNTVPDEKHPDEPRPTDPKRRKENSKGTGSGDSTAQETAKKS